MRTQKLAMRQLKFTLFLVPFSSFANEPAANAPSRPYYECMKSETEKYSKKTDQVDDAILAAGASCKEERDKLLGEIIGELIYTKGMTGNEAEEVAKIAVANVDERMRPLLVKAALDSR